MKNYSNKTVELQKQLKDLLAEIGWSKRKLAEEIVNDAARSGKPEDANREPNQEYEKIKKMLSRKTTKPETLQQYINFIVQHRENKLHKYIKMPSIDLSMFSEKNKKFIKKLGEIAEEFWNSKP